VPAITLIDEHVDARLSVISHVPPGVAPVTLRELIRERVRREVEAFNAARGTLFQGLVQPERSEAVLNGFDTGTHRPLDWEVQYARAVAAFERNGFFVLINDKQITGLDEPLPGDLAEVRFVRLMPLVGG
jgi:hypothetical protein